MKLFKLILFFFALYFIRRFWQLYKAMERRGEELKAQEESVKSRPPMEDGKVVEAEYKVMDER
jgi:hypothetical protein